MRKAPHGEKQLVQNRCGENASCKVNSRCKGPGDRASWVTVREGAGTHSGKGSLVGRKRESGLCKAVQVAVRGPLGSSASFRLLLPDSPPPKSLL